MSYSWAGAKRRGWAAKRRTRWFRREPNFQKSRVEKRGEADAADGVIFPVGSLRTAGERRIIKKARRRWLRYRNKNVGG